MASKIEFDAFDSSVGGSFVVVPGAIQEDDFTLGSSGGQFTYYTANTPVPGYLGSSAMFVHPDAGGQATIVDDEGRPFSVLSLDLGEDTDLAPGGSPASVTFTGTKSDSSTVTHIVQLDGVRGFDHVTFSGFDDLVAFSWTQTSFIQVDNIELNRAPEPIGDTAATDEDTPITIDVAGNDGDPDTAFALTVTGVDVDSALGAALSVEPDGSIGYDPDGNVTAVPAGETALDSFSYIVSDEHGATATAVVTVTVTGINDAPTAVADSAATDEDSPVTIDVLGNDLDPDSGAALVLVEVDTASLFFDLPVSVEPDGSVTFDPSGRLDLMPEGATVTDSFGYTMADEHGVTSSATVTVTITGVNDAPVAVDDHAAAHEEQAISIDVLGNDSDPDVPAILSVIGVSESNAGVTPVIGFDDAIGYDGSGHLDWVALGETATDSFQYTIEDEFGATATATVTVTVTGLNDAPEVDASTGATVARGGGVVVTAAMLHASDVDLGTEASDLSYEITATTGPDGVLLRDGVPLGLGDLFTQADIDAGRIAYVHNGNPWQPTDSFSFLVRDQHGADAGPASFAFTIVSDGVQVGTEGADNLFGGPGNDDLFGLGGNDLIVGGEGNDYMIGGDGADRMYGHGGKDWMLGGEGNDELGGDAGDDVLLGEGGDDRLYGNDGDDVLVGGAGNDFMSGDSGDDVLVGGDGNDTMSGGSGNDAMAGGEGHDVMHGDGGDDVLVGGGGDDTVHAGSGNDVLVGGDGDDKLYGDAGHDLLWGGAGDDVMYGGSGADTFYFVAGDQNASIMDFEIGVDTLIVIHQAHDFAELQGFMHQSGHDTVIEFGNGDTLTLAYTDMSHLSASDFDIYGI